MLNNEQVKQYAIRYFQTLDSQFQPTDATRNFYNDEPLVNDKERADIAVEVACLIKAKQDEQAASQEVAKESDSVSE
jgi:hypothetical protein